MCNKGQLKEYVKIALASAGAVYIVFVVTGQIDTMPVEMPFIAAISVFIGNIGLDIFLSIKNGKA